MMCVTLANAGEISIFPIDCSTHMYEYSKHPFTPNPKKWLEAKRWLLKMLRSSSNRFLNNISSEQCRWLDRLKHKATKSRIEIVAVKSICFPLKRFSLFLVSFFLVAISFVRNTFWYFLKMYNGWNETEWGCSLICYLPPNAHHFV